MGRPEVTAARALAGSGGWRSSVSARLVRVRVAGGGQTAADPEAVAERVMPLLHGIDDHRPERAAELEAVAAAATGDE